MSDAMARYEQLLGQEARDRVGGAYLHTFLGGLAAQQGDFERARALVASGRSVLDDLGHRSAVLTYCDTVLGEIELLAEVGHEAERVLSELCDELAERGDLSHLASRASDLAKAILMQGRLDEAEKWTEIAEESAAVDDVNAQMMWRPVRAIILARRGSLHRAETLALEGVRLADATDDLNRRADAHRAVGEVLAGVRAPEAATAFERAIALFVQKGNLVGEAHVRSLLGDPAFA